MRIAFLMAPEGVEQIELTEPWQAATEQGHEPVLVSTEPGQIQAFDHLDKADVFPVQLVVREAPAETFDGLSECDLVMEAALEKEDDRASKERLGRGGNRADVLSVEGLLAEPPERTLAWIAGGRAPNEQVLQR